MTSRNLWLAVLMDERCQANPPICRISLLLILTVALGGVFVLEQPGGSILEFYPTFRWALGRLIDIHGIDAAQNSVACIHPLMMLRNMIHHPPLKLLHTGFTTAWNSAKVSRVHWSMGAFGGETAKPQYAYSNSPAIRKLYHFRPTANKVKKVHTKVETCRKYKNRDGKYCYVGTKHLKDTENLEWIKIIFILIVAKLAYWNQELRRSHPRIVLMAHRVLFQLYPDHRCHPLI